MSSETKFTPEDRAIERGRDICEIESRLKTLTDEELAIVLRLMRKHRGAFLLTDAREQMYEALESAAVHLEEMRKDEKWHPVGKCPVLDMVRAALSRARGEEPAGGAADA